MVESMTGKAGPFVGDGSQREFPFGFFAQTEDHIAVFVDGAKLVEGYTVALQDEGGTVIFDTPPAAESRVAILRSVPITQETDIQNNTPFYPEVIEGALDKLTMIAQQLAEELSRCVRISPTDTVDVARVLQVILEFQESSAILLAECKKYADLAASTSVANAVGYIKIGDTAIEVPAEGE